MEARSGSRRPEINRLRELRSAGNETRESVPKKVRIVPTLTLRMNPSFTGLRENFNSENTDITFVDESEPLHRLSTHKMLLSVTSPIFFKMFQGDWKEKNQEKLPVPGGFQWEVFEAVISFLYGVEVAIEEDKLPELYKAAAYLQLEPLIMAINDKFEHLELEDHECALEFCVVAKALHDSNPSSESLAKLYSTSLGYIAGHIQNILNQRLDITSLEKETIVDIIKSEKVAAPEHILYSFLVQWTDAHVDGMLFLEVQDIFSHIRYGTIPMTQLKKLATSKFCHVVYFVSALLQFSSLDVSVLRKHPLQYCPRSAQQPFPVLELPSNCSQTTPSHVVYNGSKDATLVASLPKKACFHPSALTIRCSSLKIKYVRRNNFVWLDSTDESKVFNAYCPVKNVHMQDDNECHIKFSTPNIELHFQGPIRFLSDAQSLQRFQYFGELPWLIEITNNGKPCQLHKSPNPADY